MKWRDVNVPYKSRLEKLETMSPHELLEVNVDASKEVIRSAYLQKIKIYHPDKNDKFMKDYANRYSLIINSAYETLMSEFE